MEITPRVPAYAQVIQSYGDGGFRINDRQFKGSVLVFPDRVAAWPVRSIAELTVESLAAVGDARPPVEVLLVGCGPALARIPDMVREAMRQAEIVIDGMDTGAACRTYNVLLSEDRRVAAALIAIE